MYIKILFIILLLPSLAFSQPVKEDVREVQLFFGEITDLDCCLLLGKKTKTPFEGFLLSPYQLVFLKDTIDSWHQELQLQLKHVNDMCDAKISLCQTNRDELLDQIKLELLHCTDTSTKLNLTNKDLSKDKQFLKATLYVTVPLSIILGIYIGTRL